MIQGPQRIIAWAAALVLRSAVSPSTLLVLLGGLIVWVFSKFVDVWLHEEWETISEFVARGLVCVGLAFVPLADRERLTDEFRELLCEAQDCVSRALGILGACVHLRLQVIRRVAVYRSVGLAIVAGLWVLDHRHDDQVDRFKWMRSCLRARRFLLEGRKQQKPTEDKPNERKEP